MHQRGPLFCYYFLKSLQIKPIEMQQQWNWTLQQVYEWAAKFQKSNNSVTDFSQLDQAQGVVMPKANEEVKTM